MRRQDAIQILLAALPDLKARMGVLDLWLYGSVARDEAGSDSDVDVLVDLAENVDLLDFVGIKQELEERLGAKVDLGTRKSLHPKIRLYVERDVIHVA